MIGLRVGESVDCARYWGTVLFLYERRGAAPSREIDSAVMRLGGPFVRELQPQRPIEVLVGVGILGIPLIVGLVWSLVVYGWDLRRFLVLSMFALPVFYALGRVLGKDREARGIVAFFCIFVIGLGLFAVVAPLFLNDTSVQDVLSKVPSDSVVEIDLQTSQSIDNNFQGGGWVEIGGLFWLAAGGLALYLPRSNRWFNDWHGS